MFLTTGKVGVKATFVRRVTAGKATGGREIVVKLLQAANPAVCLSVFILSATPTGLLSRRAVGVI